MSCLSIHNQRREHHQRRGLLRFLAPLACSIAALAVPAMSLALQENPQPIVRELYVPYEELELVLESDKNRVFLSRDSYQELIAAAAEKPVEVVPRDLSALRSEVNIRIADGRGSFQADLELEVLENAKWLILPLDLSGVGLRQALLDDEPATLIRMDDGRAALLLKGKGTRKLSLVGSLLVQQQAAQQSFQIRVPHYASHRTTVEVSGDVELRSGAPVQSRTYNENSDTTEFDLLTEDGNVALVLSTNNRRTRDERSLVARSVLIDEVTSAYERLHATVSYQPLSGVIDSVRLRVPPGFEVIRAEAPEVARWEQVDNADGTRDLVVSLSEALQRRFVLQIALNRSAGDAASWLTELQSWRFPQLLPLETTGHVSVVGLWVEEQLVPSGTEVTGLLPIDSSVLQQAVPPSLVAVEPGAPRLRQTTAFFAPDDSYAWQASINKQPSRLSTTVGSILVIGDRRLDQQGSITLRSEGESRFDWIWRMPADWELTTLTSTSGQAVTWERIGSTDDGGSLLRVNVPGGIRPGAPVSFDFTANATPTGWLDSWTSRSVVAPSIVIENAEIERGAMGIVLRDDLDVLPLETEGLVPLLDNEMGTVGLGGLESKLAYRFSGESRLVLQVDRGTPTLTAKIFSMFAVAPGRIGCAHELQYLIREASTRELQFSLPISTPAEVSVRGLGELQITEVVSREEGERRFWTVRTARPVSGQASVSVNYESPIADEQELTWNASLIRAEGVDFQTAALGIEGNADLAVDVTTDARRIDEGEIALSELPLGKRLVGTFGYISQEPAVTVSIRRHDGFGLPAAVVQKGTLTTVIGLTGRAQTVAQYQLSTKATLLELELPAGSELWSVQLDEVSLKPQRSGARSLIGIPAASGGSWRSLKFIYESSIPEIGWNGAVSLPAPRLLSVTGEGGQSAPIPQADIEWFVVPPEGYDLTDRGGTVTSVQLRRPITGPELLLATVGEMLRPRWATFSMAKASRESVQTVRGYAMPGAVDAPMSAEYPMPTAEPMMSLRDSEMPTANYDSSMPLPATAAAPGAELDGFEANENSFRDRRSGAQESQMPRPSEEQPNREVSDLTSSLFAQDEEAEKAIRQSADGGLNNAPVVAPPADLSGVRSLKIELPTDYRQIRFEGLGESPELSVGVHVSMLAQWLGIFATAAGVLIGLIVRRTSRAGLGLWIMALLVIGAVPPCLTSEFDGWMPLFAGPFLAGCLLVLIEAALALVIIPMKQTAIALLKKSKISSWRPNFSLRTSLWTLVLGLVSGIALLTVASLAQAQEPIAPIDVNSIRMLLDQIDGPVGVPADAVIVPYDPERPESADEASRILIPYAKYVELWNRAYPDRPLTTVDAPYGAAVVDAKYQATLGEGNDLVIQGKLTIDVMSDQELTLPLAFAGGTLESALLDGRAARLESIAPGSPIPAQTLPLPTLPPGTPPAAMLLHLSGTGRHELEISTRFPVTRQGGWRAVAGHLPSATASQFALRTLSVGTEIRQSLWVDKPSFESQTPGEVIDVAVEPSGAINFQWRSAVTTTEVDRALTAVSTALIDVREDGVRTTWKVDLAFPGTQRDAFTLTAPTEWSVDGVTGSNLRGYEVKVEGGRQLIDVTLLQAVSGTESLLVTMSRRESLQGRTVTIDVPYVTVRDAALESGELAVRRSSRLELITQLDEGVSRHDVSDALRALEAVAEQNDATVLNLVPHQAFRFVKPPFLLRLESAPAEKQVSAEWRAALRVDRREVAFDALFRFTPKGEPLYRVEISWPAGYQLDRLSPEGLEWSVVEVDGRRRLEIELLDGRTTPFELTVFARTDRATDVMEGVGDRLELPRLDLPGIDDWKGDWAVLTDPDTSVGIENAIGVRERPVSEVNWLQQQQKSLAKNALEVLEPNYSAEVVLSARVPQVSARSLTNVRITSETVEETALIDFQIRQAGVREVRLDLPESWQNARVLAKLLRRQTWAPAVNGDGTPRAGWLTLTLELQDAVRGSYTVLLEHDRAADGETREVYLPEIRTGRTERRLLAIENVGRDEVVVEPSSVVGMEPVNRQQQAWRDVIGVLGDSIAQLYAAREGQVDCHLALTTVARQEVERVGAKIALATTTLVVDHSGAYRAKVEYRVSNASEQSLEVVLPAGATLWTTIVAGEPVRPNLPPGTTGSDRVRIPLIKTAVGEGDYGVELQYGGRIQMTGLGGQINFPLISETSINVELSQLRLYLPEDQIWFDFDGTMRQVQDEGGLAVGFQTYLGKRIQDATQSMLGGDSGGFGSIRLSSNLKQTRELFELKKMEIQQQGQADSGEYRRVEAANESLLREAELQVQEQLEDSLADGTDNRARLNAFYDQQGLERSSNVVSDLDVNFGVVQLGPQAGSLDFNGNWLMGNYLNSADASKLEIGSGQADLGSRVYRGRAQSQAEDAEVLRQQNGRSLELNSRSNLAAPQAMEPAGNATEEARDKLDRYQSRIDQVDANSRGLGNRSAGGAGAAFGGGGGQAPDIQTGPQGPIGGGFGLGGGSMDDLIGEIPQTVDYGDTGWDSLELQIPERGRVYRFTTPRGGIEVTARVADRDQVERYGSLAVILPVLLVGGLISLQVVRRGRWRLLDSRLGGALVLLLSVGLMIAFGPAMLTLLVAAFGVFRIVRPRPELLGN